MKKQIRINNQIRAEELRVIDDAGENFGVIKFEEAIKIAKEKGLDLIEIAPTAKPPVAKIMDFGKFQYQQQRKEKTARKSRSAEVRSVRIGLGTSNHDLEMKAKKTSDFLKKGDRVNIELILRGRAKYLNRQFIEERLKRILDFITEKYKIVGEPKKGPRGMSMLIEKS